VALFRPLELNEDFVENKNLNFFKTLRKRQEFFVDKTFQLVLQPFNGKPEALLIGLVFPRGLSIEEPLKKNTLKEVKSSSSRFQKERRKESLRGENVDIIRVFHSNHRECFKKKDSDSRIFQFKKLGLKKIVCVETSPLRMIRPQKFILVYILLFFFFYNE